MSKRVLVPLASGFEELEAVAIIDILRRAHLDVTVAGVGERTVTGSHNIAITADTTMEQAATGAYDLVVLPGGMPGTTNLASDPNVAQVVRSQADSGRWVAAICAAPLVLDQQGILKGKRATSHFSVGNRLHPGRYVEDRVVVDGKVVTSRGAGTAVEFALTLVELVAGPDEARKISDAILNGMPIPQTA